MNEDNDNGSDLCPTLQLVETYGEIKDKENGKYVVYETEATFLQISRMFV